MSETDDKEFSDNLVRLMPRLRIHATVLLRSEPDGDDLLQEVLVRAWRFRDTFQPGSSMTAWVFRIMRNEFLNRIKRRKVHLPFVGEDWRAEFSTQADQEWKFTYGEFLTRLDDLPEASRQALLLVGGCGLTYEEAAYVCDCAPGTIKSRVSRARDRIAKLMDLSSEFHLPTSPPGVGASASELL